MNTKRLEMLWNKATSSIEYFEAIYLCATLDPRHAMQIRNGSPVRAIFFGGEFTTKFAQAVLDYSASADYFATLEELRFVATRINRSLASEFNRLNPRMKIYWISKKEWLDREPGAPDPAGLEESIETMNYEPLCKGM